MNDDPIKSAESSIAPEDSLLWVAETLCNIPLGHTSCDLRLDELVTDEFAAIAQHAKARRLEYGITDDGILSMYPLPQLFVWRQQVLRKGAAPAYLAAKLKSQEQYRLVCFLWPDKTASYEALCDGENRDCVWSNHIQPDSIRVAVQRLNKRLFDLGEVFELVAKNNHVSIRWFDGGQGR